MIRALIFDLDGTLLNTLEDIAAPVNAALARRGYPTHPTQAYTRMVGNGFRNLVRAALPPAAATEAAIAELHAEAAANYAAAPVVHTRPYAGVPELLAELARRGLPRAILSNKPDALARETAARCLPGAGFLLVRGETPAFPRKPDPTAAVDIAGRFGLPPEEIAYVGDSDVDMETARRAGMIGVGAAWGFRGEEELRAAGARYILHRPLDLLDLLG